MEFIDVKVTIDVDFGTMTIEQYQEFISVFEDHFLNRKQVSNKDIFEKLDLDKRPFFVTSLKNIEKKGRLIQNAEINFKC